MESEEVDAGKESEEVDAGMEAEVTDAGTEAEEADSEEADEIGIRETRQGCLQPRVLSGMSLRAQLGPTPAVTFGAGLTLSSLPAGGNTPVKRPSLLPQPQTKALVRPDGCGKVACWVHLGHIILSCFEQKWTQMQTMERRVRHIRQMI